MPRLTIIFAIAACYFVYAILLNSVGTVILQSIHTFEISKPLASSLEGFKDLSIAFVSFAIASFIPRLGYKISILTGLAVVAVATLLTPFFESFGMIQVLFGCIGASFALVKISVYSIVGQLNDDAKGHASLLNIIEGIFMLGVLFGYWLFSWFISVGEPSNAWLDVYYILFAAVCITALLVYLAPISPTDVSAKHQNSVSNFVEMIKMSYQPLVLIFILSIFLYVLVEQGIGTWLPTFNNEVLKLPIDVSIQLTSLFAGAIALGRLFAGGLLRILGWYSMLNICLLGMATLMLVTIPASKALDDIQITSVFSLPMSAYILPMIGFFMSPIYPILNSVMLSSMARKNHASMTGLIVVFSALGGTTGSVITGFVFEFFGGLNAFLSAIVPIVGIALSLYFFRRKTFVQSV